MMMTSHMERLSVLLIVLGLVSGCAKPPVETGTLHGQVSIGPLVPVVRAGEPEPTAAPEVYAARQVVIYEADGQEEVIRVEIDATGTYSVTLPVGTYVVDINRAGIDSANGLPRQIELRAGEDVLLDIEIDTGIR
jgi:hypothetical protein